MKLMHVVPRVDQEAAGPSYSVPRLCEALAWRGHEVQLSCMAARDSVQGVRLDLHPQWPVFDRFAVSPSLVRTMRRMARDVDIVHNHSLWSMVNLAAGWVVPGQNAKLVTSPRGTLSPIALRRSRAVKSLFKPLQWRALTRANLLHATSEVECEEIRAIGLDAPIAVIPNGIDIPVHFERSESEETRTLLYLSRIHPIKGLDRLLNAWQGLQDIHPEWSLLVAGRGEPDHVREAKALAEKLKLRRVTFPGALYGEAKGAAYRGADVFVLPTHSENFGMVVAEALAHGCPVVVSRGAPWSEVSRQGCGWWVDNSVNELAYALDQAMRLPRSDLLAMGQRGRGWMQRDFGWDSVSEKMEAAYRWVCSGVEEAAGPWIRRS